MNARLVGALAIILASPPGAAHDSPTTPDSVAAVPHRGIIDRRIEAYNRAFGEVRFVHFNGGEEWHGEAVALATALGSDADPIDYQHPGVLRTELMHVTLERVVHMLRTSTISATTFRLSAGNPFGRPYLCVVTMNPQDLVRDEFAATRAFLGASKETMRRVNPTRYLDHDSHLTFALDHEVFHCLDSIRYGGAPRSFDGLHAAYARLMRESAADVFALAMHLRTHERVTRYARNVTHIRALAPFMGDPDRGTFEALREILGIDSHELAGMRVQQIVEIAHTASARVVGTYDDFISCRAAAYHATRAMGLEPGVSTAVTKQLAQLPLDPAHVARLADRYRYFYAQLFTDADVTFYPPWIIDPE